jgi:dTDP-4-dehydrorhamnose 3,5-epimerase
MRFQRASLAGVCIIEVDAHVDERGLFARTFCARAFSEQGLVNRFVQYSTSWNARTGTVRGLHHQLPPASEVKLVRCSAGSMLDVVVDLRPESPTYLQHASIELSARTRRALYIPERFAHGFQTLEDDTEVFYQISVDHAPELSAGMRYDDPRLSIPWPCRFRVSPRGTGDGRCWPERASHSGPGGGSPGRESAGSPRPGDCGGPAPDLPEHYGRGSPIGDGEAELGSCDTPHTSAPRPVSRRQTCEPMNPRAPVTSTRRSRQSVPLTGCPARSTTGRPYAAWPRPRGSC